MSQVEIIHFTRDERGSKIGYVDFKITYTLEKMEEYRNWAIFVSDTKKWISDPKVRRDIKQPDGSIKEIWKSIYSRTPPLPKEIYSKVLSLLEEQYI